MTYAQPAVQYVGADGQPVQYLQQPVQYVVEQPAVQYVSADGQPVQYLQQPVQHVVEQLKIFTHGVPQAPRG